MNVGSIMRNLFDEKNLETLSHGQQEIWTTGNTIFVYQLKKINKIKVDTITIGEEISVLQNPSTE